MDVRDRINAELPQGRVPFVLDADTAVARGRAARRRRAAAWGTAGLPVVAAAVLVVVAQGTPLALLPQPAAPDAAIVPSTSDSPSPPWQGWRELPDFPFTPGWVPPGLSEPHYWYLDMGGQPMTQLLHYGSGGSNGISAQVRPDDTGAELDKLKAVHSDPDRAITDELAAVHGRDARLITITGTSDEDEDEAPLSVETAAVSWQHRPDRWVTVYGDNAANVLRYAEELVEEPFPAQVPFAFDVVPDGAEVAATDPSAMQLWLPDTQPPGDGTAAIAGALDVSLTQGVPELGLMTETECRQAEAMGTEPPLWPEHDGWDPCPNREPVQIDDHNGELIGDDTVLVYLAGGLVLRVQDGTGSLSREELVSFAAGVHLTPHARPAGW